MPSNAFLGLEMTLVRMACIGRVQPLNYFQSTSSVLRPGFPVCVRVSRSPGGETCAGLGPPGTQWAGGGCTTTSAGSRSG
jgi:hypothetical protein